MQVAIWLCSLSYLLAFQQFSRSLKLLGNKSAPLFSTTTAKTSDKIGWDSHTAIDSIPDSLVREIDGNESMRRKFEQVCRNAQV